mgnify:CR=1 FL=1
MSTKIRLNEADLDLIESNLISYLNSVPEFSTYNFKSGSLAIFIRVAKFVIRNLAYQLNKTVEEIFLDTASLEESIYSLIENFNFIPEMRRPAKKYLKINYDLDTYTPLANSQFKMFFNNVKYTDEYQIIPTLRDKWQQSSYTDVDANAFLNQNMFYCQLEKIGNTLQATIPVYQATWNVVESVVDILTFTQEVELKDISSVYYNDKVIKDSIRVFVKETDGSWYEYYSLREGNFDEDLRSYNLKFNATTGLSIQFDIDHLSRTILDTETIRVFFATTEGDEINDTQGNNEFEMTDFHDFQVFEVQTDGTEVLIAEYNYDSVTPVISPTNLSDLISAELVDGEGTLSFFDNGVERQSLESIKINAPLFRTTQGRAVTESDYNVLLKNKFSEYRDIRAWGGQREYIDIEDMIDDAIATYGDAKTAIKYVLSVLYTGGTLSIDDVDYTSIESGTYRRDLGFVYYSFYDDGFNFVNSSENTDEIIKYLDRYKILTIYFKYRNPVFNLLKPKIKLTLNPSYASEFSLFDTKTLIKNWVNEKSKTQTRIDLQDMFSMLLAMDEVDVVDSISSTSKIKYFHEAGENTVRVFNRFLGNQNCQMKVWIGNELTTIANLTTNSADEVLIDGIVAGKVNPRIGAFQFESAILTPYEDKVIYIDNLKLSGLKINQLRESVVGIERISDIELIVE